MQRPIAVFETSMATFNRRTRNRLLAEFGLCLLAVSAVVYPTLLASIPGWARVSVASVVLIFFFYDLFSYPASKRMAECFRLHVYDDGIGLVKQGVPEKMMFSDIRSYKVRMSGEKIGAIKLETRFGLSVTLSGLQRMDELKNILNTYVRK